MNRATVVTSLIAGLLSAACAAQAAPTPTPSPTVSAVALPYGGNVTPGRYYTDAGGYRYTFTVGDAGWDRGGDTGNVLIRHDPDQPEHGILWLWGQIPPSGADAGLFRDPCHWRGTGFTPGPSVDDYATALTTIPEWHATQPMDVTVGGHQGKRVQLTVPADANFSACDDAQFHLNDGRWYQSPGQTEDMRILDFDGARYLVFTSWFPTTPASVRAQLDQMVDSMTIEKL